MLLLYLGVEDKDKQLSDDAIKTLLNDIGWRQMTDQEYDDYVKSKHQ
jgi:hypothetical protein